MDLNEDNEGIHLEDTMKPPMNDFLTQGVGGREWLGPGSGWVWVGPILKRTNETKCNSMKLKGTRGNTMKQSQNLTPSSYQSEATQ